MRLNLEIKNKINCSAAFCKPKLLKKLLLKKTLFVFLLAIPWLNPFSRTPSPPMIPWLVSLACVGFALWAAPTELRLQSLSRKILVFFGLNAVYLSFHMLGVTTAPSTLAGLIAWSAVLAMAYVGASLRVADQSVAIIRALATMWLVVAIASVAMGLLQYLRMEHWFDPWISQSAYGVAFANLRQRNLFATLCGIGLVALLYLYQSSVSTVKKLADSCYAERESNAFFRYWQASWPWLAVVALAIGNGISGSRTGALQWVFVSLSLVCWRSSLHSSVKRLGYGSLIIYISVQMLMPWFAGAVGNEISGMWGRAQQTTTENSRLWLYNNVLDLIAQKPLLGWGWQELSYAQYTSHFDLRFTELLDNAHNLPLHLAVELGLPYAVLFFSVIVVWIVRAAPWREHDTTRQLAWGVLMLIGLHSMLEYPLWYGPFLITLGLCIGLLQERGVKKNISLAQAEFAQAVKVFLIGFFLIITTYTTYDYHRVSQLFLSQESRSSIFRYNTWSYAKKSWLFKRNAQFVELVNTPVSAQTAPHLFELASDLIHFSSEPRVIQALIESAALLRKDDAVLFHVSRYKEAYPKEYEAWMASK